MTIPEGKNYYDFTIVNHKLNTTQGFDQALLMSILCEKRASSSEVSAPEKRRGWWGNEVLGFGNYNIGSKLWLLFQARANQDTLNNAITYTRDGLQWLINDGYVIDINVSAEYNIVNTQRVLDITIVLIRSKDSVETRGFRLWQNTGQIELIES